MRIKDKTLIKYFGTKNITKDNFEKNYHNFAIDCSKVLIDIEEALKILEIFSDDIHKFCIIVNDNETLKNVLSRLPSNNSIKEILIIGSNNGLELTLEDLVNLPNLKLINIGGLNDNIVIKNIELPSSLEKLYICRTSEIQNIDFSNVELKPYISINDLSNTLVNSLSNEIAEKVDDVCFDISDRNIETINIEKFLEKFCNLQKIINSPILDERIENLSVVTEMVNKCGVVNVSSNLCKKYQIFYENNVSDKGLNFSFSSRQILSQGAYQEKNNRGIYFGAELRKIDDFSVLKKIPSLIFEINSMVDLPFDVANKLAREEIECSIKMNSYDNSEFQNTTYTLNEYITIFFIMDGLIGEIDDNLSEEEKFKEIYTRVISFIEYDYYAAYPKTRRDNAYSKRNKSKCRNLLNALTDGRAVCAGYADVLKNACLLKGLECEYIQGPVDSLMTKESYLQDAGNIGLVVYSDDKDVIVREYHAWNKVKINGVWYNCDPTWDKQYIVNEQVPKYALISDEIYRNIGRPTTENLRNPCSRTASSSEKNKIFCEFEPCNDLCVQNKLIEFESTVDENGDPRQLPTVQKVTLWSKIIDDLKKFSKQSKVIFDNFIYKIKRKINSDLDNKQDELPTIYDSERERTSLPVINGINKNDVSVKRPSWKLSKEQFKEIEESKISTTDKNKKLVESKGKEVGDR